MTPTVAELAAQAFKLVKDLTPEQAEILNSVFQSIGLAEIARALPPAQQKIEAEGLAPERPPSFYEVFADKRKLADAIEKGARGIKDQAGWASLMPTIPGMPNISGTITMEMQMPSTAARLDIAQQIYGAPFKYGQDPLIRRYFNRLYQPMLPDPRILAALKARNALSRDFFESMMADQGYPAWAAGVLEDFEFRAPSFSELLDLLRRGAFGEDTFKAWLRRSALHPDILDPLTKLRWQLPGYADIISVYMREGYLAEKWVEIPPEFTTYMEQLGYNRDWTLRIWGKHWVLPSVDLLYEMFWKKIITFDDMVLMLKYHDFEPVWRQRLIQNAYRMVPRVDIRRGYRYGYLEPEQLQLRYEALGFKPSDAEIMAGIAKRESLTAYYSAIETRARAVFKEGLMSEGEFRGWLQKSGLPEEAISLALDAENLAYRLDYAKDLIAMATEGFRKDVYTAEEVCDRLAALGMQPERINALLALEILRKLPKPRPVS